MLVSWRDRDGWRGVGPAGAVPPSSPHCTAPDGPFGRGVKPPAGTAAGPAPKDAPLRAGEGTAPPPVPQPPQPGLVKKRRWTRGRAPCSLRAWEGA